MSDFKLPLSFRPQDLSYLSAEMEMEMDSQVTELLEMASLLSPQDMKTLSVIVRRAAEISESEGEDVAIAVLDQIHGIFAGRPSDA